MTERQATRASVAASSTSRPTAASWRSRRKPAISCLAIRTGRSISSSAISRAGHIWRANVATRRHADARGHVLVQPDRSRRTAATWPSSPNAATLVADDTNENDDVFVHDSQTGETTRVSVVDRRRAGRLNGERALGHRSATDGRYVAFQSKAWNFGGVLDHYNVYVHDRQLVRRPSSTATPMAPPRGRDACRLSAAMGPPWSSASATRRVCTNLYAAVDFSVTPASISLNANGTAQTITVTTTPVTGWTAVAHSVVTVDHGDRRRPSRRQRHGAGRRGGEHRHDATYGHVIVDPKTVTVTQAGAFSVQTVSPTSGTASGGTTVTITGSGFTQGAAVRFGGMSAVTTFVSSTTLTAVTPPHDMGFVDVEVTNGDGTTAVLHGRLSLHRHDAARDHADRHRHARHQWLVRQQRDDHVVGHRSGVGDHVHQQLRAVHAERPTRTRRGRLSSAPPPAMAARRRVRRRSSSATRTGRG